MYGKNIRQNRQHDCEVGSLADLAFDLDGSPYKIDGPFYNMETEAGALDVAAVGCAEEPFEEVFLVVGGDADALVLD